MKDGEHIEMIKVGIEHTTAFVDTGAANMRFLNENSLFARICKCHSQRPTGLT